MVVLSVEGVGSVGRRAVECCGDEQMRAVEERIHMSCFGRRVDGIWLSSVGGKELAAFATVDELSGGCDMVVVRMCGRLPGGKGGFGQLLKQRARKMKKREGETASELSRKLDGRRVRTVKQLKQLDELEKTVGEEQKRRLAERRDRLQRIIDSSVDDGSEKMDTKLLDAIDRQLEEIRELVGASSASSSSSSASEEDSDSSDTSDTRNTGTNLTKTQPAKKFQNFFD